MGCCSWAAAVGGRLGDHTSIAGASPRGGISRLRARELVPVPGRCVSGEARRGAVRVRCAVRRGSSCRRPRSGSVTKWLRRAASALGGLQLPPHAGLGIDVGVLEQTWRLDPQDRARHGHGFVAAAHERHLATGVEVHGDVRVEREPPVRQSLGRGDRIPHVVDGVGQLTFEADDASVRSAFEGAVVGRGGAGRSSGLLRGCRVRASGSLQVSIEGVQHARPTPLDTARARRRDPSRARVEVGRGVAPRLAERLPGRRRGGSSRWRDAPGWCIPTSSTSSPTDRSPTRTASRMRRRVGSAITSRTAVADMARAYVIAVYDVNPHLL